MAAKEGEKKAATVEKKSDVITAVYRVNLHCPECAREIRKPLLRTQGVHGVEVNLESNEVKVKGSIDPVKIYRKIEKLSKRTVELVSPKIKITKETEEFEKKVKEVPKKEAPVRTTNLKVYMHCDQCERDLRRKLIAHRGIYSVKTDLKAQTLTVEGTIEPEKLRAYVQRKTKKIAEIIPPKPEKKEDKKEGKKEEKKEGKKEEKKETKVTEEKEKVKIVETKGKEVVEFTEEKKVVEVKTKESQPYFIHYVYAPQTFSDENPNACAVM